MTSSTSPTATSKSSSSLSILLKGGQVDDPNAEVAVKNSAHEPDPLLISRHFVYALNECDWDHWSNRHFAANYRAKHDNSRSELTWEDQQRMYKAVRTRFPKYHMEILSESVDIDEVNGQAVVWHFIRITGAPENTQRDGLGMVKWRRENGVWMCYHHAGFRSCGAVV